MALGLGSERPGCPAGEGEARLLSRGLRAGRQHFTRLARFADGQTFVYSMLWLELAIRRGALPRQSRLVLAEGELVRQWPAPIIQMQMEKMEPAQAIAAAAAPDPRVALMQQCEANFYAGQEYLIRHQPQQARAAFEAAIATGETEFPRVRLGGAGAGAAGVT